MMIFLFFFDRVETEGKGKNASYQHFLLNPQFFKRFFTRVVKSRDCVRVNMSANTVNPCQTKQCAGTPGGQIFLLLFYFLPVKGFRQLNLYSIDTQFDASTKDKF